MFHLSLFFFCYIGVQFFQYVRICTFDHSVQLYHYPSCMFYLMLWLYVLHILSVLPLWHLYEGIFKNGVTAHLAWNSTDSAFHRETGCIDSLSYIPGGHHEHAVSCSQCKDIRSTGNMFKSRSTQCDLILAYEGSPSSGHWSSVGGGGRGPSNTMETVQDMVHCWWWWNRCWQKAVTNAQPCPL